ncbi:hypothetical protein FK220_001940 [Flavobacteriaceae bacterium TP-CH-4]|uniref:Uncharacterized protein n=1 Tax=Pelagihabitans pacificus TaxID=2696054 RepID=A0A967E5H5_9FLAO|nr:hypothetical protein [Pelagihabitans pacificus]NHF58084.1 hypothetical protein [Pelagihabitans pacificus]
MERDKEKELNDFIKKVVSEVGVESPSPNFTDSVLSKIQAGKQADTVAYTPLISRTGWYLMGAVVVVIFAFIILGNGEMDIPWLASSDIETLSNNLFLEAFSNLQVSNTVLYGMAGLAFFVTIQVVLLKNHFGRRLVVS